MKASQVIINCPNHNELMIGPNTFAAKNAFAQIPNNKRVCLFQGFVIRHGVKLCLANAHLSGDPAQLTPVAFAADNTRFRMFGDHQPHNIAAMADNARRVGSNGHVLSCGGDACGHQPAGFFIFYQAQPAGAKGFQIRMITKMRNFNAIFRSSF